MALEQRTWGLEEKKKRLSWKVRNQSRERNNTNEGDRQADFLAEQKDLK